MDAIPMIFLGITSITLMILAIPCCFASIVMAFGDNKRIKFFDDQLCKSPNKKQFYSYIENPWRFMVYSYSYPWIRHRATTKSKWFKVFMWINTIYYYCWPIGILWAIVITLLDLL